MLRRLSKYIIYHTYRPLLLWYLQKPRNYFFDGIKIKVPSGIFHPGLFFSTKLLIEYLDQQELSGKSLLELGCGSGFISIWCAKKHAVVTASDINPMAVRTTTENAADNQVDVKAVESDLFNNINGPNFDFIIINPPYYAKDAESDAEKAWYCGSNFEYFERLFSGLRSYIEKGSTVLMVLSDNCEIDRISAIAQKQELKLHIVYYKKLLLETNYIFNICSA